MDAFFQWIREIAIYMIFTAVILNMAVSEKSQKYVKIFLGLVLMTLILKPLNLLGEFSSQVEDYVQAFTMQQELGELGTQLSQKQKSLYEKALIRQLNQELTQDQYEIRDLEMQIEQGTFKGVTLTMTDKMAGMSAGQEEHPGKEQETVGNKIKTFFKDFYNLTEENINIIIQ